MLLLLLLPLVANADTSQNLISNGTFDNGTAGWTLSGDAQRIGDCCPGGHDLEFGDYGSIEQTFKLYSDTITQPMLDNGVTLNSTVEVQNGEGGVGSWAPNRGGADTFTIRLQIKDNQGSVLATTTQERTDVTGINGQDFTDTVSYTGTGANVGNIFISGSDANAPANLGGPNVDNISVTMEYDPVVLSTEIVEEIQEIFEEIETIEFEEPVVEEVVVEEYIVEEIEYIEPVEEIVEIEETILLTEIVTEEVYEENVETTVEEESVQAEEIIEPTETAEETTVADDSSTDDVNISVEEIAIKVADKIKTIDGQLKATQMIVAKVMARDNKIASYSQVNADIFIQPELVDANIDSYIASSYVDIRQIYSNQTYEDTLWTSRQ
tara:strand:- start:36704 stop:37846 length:1143 start_codon:yes stop_codon:yes gene_type:complete